MEDKVIDILYYTYNKSGYFTEAIIVRKLREYFWPQVLVNIINYILEYLPYAKYIITY
jgi:hypothetical protein